MSSHTKKSPRNSSISNSQPTTTRERQDMPNIVPATSSSPSFSDCSTSSFSPVQRTYYWHASSQNTPPTPYYGAVVVEPYYWQQQQQQQPQQEWASPPPPPQDVYHQIEALNTQVHEWRNNAQSWQRHCEEINRAHEKETLKLKAKVNELLRQKAILSDRIRRYKVAAVASANKNLKAQEKKENTTPVSPITKNGETSKTATQGEEHKDQTKLVSILRSPKTSSPRPLKKRRVRLDETQQQVRCISPRTVSSAPPMPVTPPTPQVKWANL